MSALYFAYGSNLHMDGMAARCRDSVPIRPVTLKDWQLVFRYYADIEPAPGKTVEGALYFVSPADIAALDAHEGVSNDLYRRHTMVLDETGEAIFFYVMTRDDIMPPMQSYFETIQTGYADWHIPGDSLAAALLKAY